MKQRVVITGLGAVSPLGQDSQSTWEAARSGQSGITRTTCFDSSQHKSQIAGEVKDWDPVARFGRREARRIDRYMQFALAAANEALEQSGLQITADNCHRVGVLMGTASCGLTTLLEQAEVLREKGAARVNPFLIPKMLSDSAAGYIALTHSLRGPNLSVASACATGNNAIGEAYRMIRHGSADAMVCGASEAALVPLMIAGFENMGALSTHNHAPQQASRPFDKERDGFVPGEGAGALVLESEAHARQRGAHILAELCGYALNNDAHHMTAPAEDGSGAAQCMRLVLADAGLAITEIDYINAHGTSTPLNDASETAAIKTVFGEQAYNMPISSSKSMHGHLLGAAGAVEAVISVMAITNSIIPPTINYTTPDPACDLDYVPNQARPATLNYVLSNSFGFGGHNASLIFGAYRANGAQEHPA